MARGRRRRVAFFRKALACILLGTSSIVILPEAKAAACTPETTISGSYTIVAFKTVGTCTWSTPAGTNVFRGLIVAGGGGGGYDMGGGGGGGGYVEFESLTVTNDVLTIVVGGGGAGATTLVAGTSGGNSTISGSGISLVSRGGAGGATYYGGSYPAQSNGGSGGGAAGRITYGSPSSNGTQTSQSQTPSLASISGAQFGFNGNPGSTAWYPGGGGGAGGDGSNSPANGGIGRQNDILGTNYFWAGGGGGSGYSGNAGAGGNGGGGGGGAGQYTSVAVGVGGSGLNSGATGTYHGGAAGANTGGGGGGGTHSGNFGGNGGSGIVVLRYLTFASPAVFTSAAAPRTNTTSPITFSITFSQNVDSVTAADFSNSGTATGCTFSVNASSGTSFTLTASGCSEGTLIPQILAGSVFGTVTGTNGPTTNSPTTTPVIIDRTLPTISSVAAPANATYKPSDTPTFTVVFSESVTVTGTPRLTLTVGSSTEYANYLSMSDSKTALFRYTVGVDPIEFDTDGISISTSLDLNSGSIADLATNALSTLTFTAPTLTSVLVAQPAAAPTIDSITATSGQLAIYFTPGAARGSTTSTYQYTTNNGSSWTNRPTGTTASPLTITGLTDGTGYTVRLRAVTNAGNSDSSTAVTETPTAITVTGDGTLTLTYGTSASTSAYSATGGTNSYTWSLGSVISGVSISGSTVTASSSTAAGTYSQTVRATDGNSQVGTKTLTITVNKATTSISIALPNSASSAALGGAVTITATVSRAGSVNFKLGGSTISGCGAAAAASTTATCSWTPASLGSVSLTAIFTPTDSANFETSTTTSLTITVVNGVSTVALSLTGGTTTPPKGQSINIIAAIDQAGKVTFLIDGKRIPGCINKSGSPGNVLCSWRPAVQRQVTITATLNPTNNVYNNSTSSLKVWVVRRSGSRG